MADKNRFCVDCWVSIDLHPDGEVSAWACGIADRKAQLIEAFGDVRSVTPVPLVGGRPV